MKKHILFITVMITSLSFSQNNATENNGAQMFGYVASSSRSYGSTSGTFINPAKKAQGSVHLFKDWNNLAVIHSSDAQKFSLKNINLNIERNTFESKTSEDSIFTFNFNNIDKFVINNRVFKNYYNDGENRVFEVIYDSGQLVLLKGYKIQFVKGSPNPMLNRSTDKNVQKEFYFIRQNSSIRSFRLKKSNILDLLSPDQAKAAEKYVKDNRLSYKEDADVNRILTHGFSN
ncbi:MAG: hypothetical protein ACI83H_000004 [Glaciecola sp.]|jgi:hypothetical protein